ncbi:MAG: hypothetical protein A3J62_01045 [Candidatus Buchananbacteria bacterium RIFCSPHIGHO2_02_FULL_38_8]|uniref:Uncharacterized protein n=1 Tax=Candidatus Buchananbacteria bacterium RIFCSPHIGHO2_02_FULL_38_8 TaxID=1797538 RepID=A0A1G1Y645_9BACT|nr:MAG: hypothetical protein A3J62_01045 [Candidatus Buchananbacteria bacterium RIFCSPHIGHO2_02_FULL_38_8]
MIINRRSLHYRLYLFYGQALQKVYSDFGKTPEPKNIFEYAYRQFFWPILAIWGLIFISLYSLPCSLVQMVIKRIRPDLNQEVRERWVNYIYLIILFVVIGLYSWKGLLSSLAGLATTLLILTVAMVIAEIFGREVTVGWKFLKTIINRLFPSIKVK